MVMLGVLFPIHCGLWIVASFIEGLWFLMHPSFGLLLSCFGHARAKKNFELSCGLSCVHRLVGIVNRSSLPSSQGCEGIVLLRYAVVGLRTVVSGMWRLGMLEKASVVATSLALAFPSSLMTW